MVAGAARRYPAPMDTQPNTWWETFLARWRLHRFGSKRAAELDVIRQEQLAEHERRSRPPVATPEQGECAACAACGSWCKPCFERAASRNTIKLSPEGAAALEALLADNSPPPQALVDLMRGSK